MSRKTVKMLLIFCIVILILISTIIIADFNYVLQGRKPVFCLYSKQYEDGGTIEYIGLGYKIIKYNAISGRQDVELGSILKKYDPKIDTSKIKVEADNKNKIYNIIGVVENIQMYDNKHVFTIIYNNDKKVKIIETYGTLVYKNDFKANILDIKIGNKVQLRTSTLDKLKEVPEAIVEIINIVE